MGVGPMYIDVLGTNVSYMTRHVPAGRAPNYDSWYVLYLELVPGMVPGIYIGHTI